VSAASRPRALDADGQPGASAVEAAQRGAAAHPDQAPPGHLRAQLLGEDPLEAGPAPYRDGDLLGRRDLAAHRRRRVARPIALGHEQRAIAAAAQLGVAVVGRRDQARLGLGAAHLAERLDDRAPVIGGQVGPVGVGDQRGARGVAADLAEREHRGAARPRRGGVEQADQPRDDLGGGGLAAARQLPGRGDQPGRARLAGAVDAGAQRRRGVAPVGAQQRLDRAGRELLVVAGDQRGDDAEIAPRRRVARLGERGRDTLAIAIRHVRTRPRPRARHRHRHGVRRRRR
jgi:hypothetical protein